MVSRSLNCYGTTSDIIAIRSAPAGCYAMQYALDIIAIDRHQQVVKEHLEGEVDR